MRFSTLKAVQCDSKSAFKVACDAVHLISTEHRTSCQKQTINQVTIVGCGGSSCQWANGMQSDDSLFVLLPHSTTMERRAPCTACVSPCTTNEWEKHQQSLVSAASESADAGEVVQLRAHFAGRCCHLFVDKSHTACSLSSFVFHISP